MGFSLGARPQRAPARLSRPAAGPGKWGLLSWLGAFLLALTGAANVGAEVRPPGLAPEELAGMQFSLDGISSEGVHEGLTLLFRDEREFNATRTLPEGLPLDNFGSYTYRRTGPDTATLATTSASPGQETCSTSSTSPRPPPALTPVGATRGSAARGISNWRSKPLHSPSASLANRS